MELKSVGSVLLHILSSICALCVLRFSYWDSTTGHPHGGRRQPLLSPPDVVVQLLPQQSASDIYLPTEKKGERGKNTTKNFIHLSNQPAKTIGIFPLSSALCFCNRTRPRFEMSANSNARKSFAILVFHALNRYHDIQLQQWEEEES